MPAKYQFFKTPSAQKEGGNTLYPRIVQSEVIQFEEICQRIANRSTFQKGEVEGIISLFQDEMIQALEEGAEVCLRGIGNLKATAKCDPVEDPKAIRAESIHFSRVVFKASKELRRKLKNMKFERATHVANPEMYTPEARQARILRYLNHNQQIQSSDCMALNRCSRYMAIKDLSYLYEQRQLTRLGGPKTAVYVLPQ